MTEHNAEGEGVTPLSDLEDAQLVVRIRFQEMRAERAENRAAEVGQELTTLRTAAAEAMIPLEVLHADRLARGRIVEIAPSTYEGIEAGVMALRAALLPATSTGDRPAPESEGAQG